MAQTGHALTRADVMRIERAAARAWPAARTVDIDGWTWRGSGGGSRRANSVLPLAFTGRNLDDAIDRVEALYREQSTRSYFQVTSVAEPEGLDARLAARGYTYEEPCLLLARSIEPMPMPAGVEVMPEPSAAWLAVYTELLSADRRRDLPRLLAGVPAPRAFLLASGDDGPVATALAVVSPDGIGLVESVATLSSQRRTGAARRVMDGLVSWSASAGARISALQVVADNSPARALYEGRGYAEVGHYHYRWRDAV